MSVSTLVLDPAALGDELKGLLIEELFTLNCAIFEGVGRDVFEHYLLGPDAQRTRIQVVRDAGRAVGYTAIQVYDGALPEEHGLVVRTLAGMLPEYRRRTLFGGFMAYEVLRLRLLHPLRPIYGFACPVHPTTYRMLARYAVDVWPRPDRATPSGMLGRLGALAAHFGLTPEAAQPGVCYVGWKTIQSPQERRHWATSSHPASRYFVQMNPRYSEGYGLLLVVPMKLSRVAQGLMKLGARRLVHSRRHRQGTVVPGGAS